MVADWAAFLDSALPEEELRELRQHGRTGRPLGSSSFPTAWRGWLVASSGRRKGAGQQSYADYHNQYCVPGIYLMRRPGRSVEGALANAADAALTPMQRLQNDIADVRSLFGTKYDTGIEQLLNYARTLPQFQ